MKKIYMFLNTNLRIRDLNLIQDYESYKIEKVYSDRISFTDWLDNYQVSCSDEVYILVSTLFTLGNSLDDFMTTCLRCIEKGLKVVFKFRNDLSFDKVIDYKVYTTVEQQKAAFCSLYSLTITNIFAHKNGRKRKEKDVKLLRNYWLAYVYKNGMKFKGSLTHKQLLQNLKISTTLLHQIKEEIKQMLENGKQQELEEMVMNELYKGLLYNARKITDRECSKDVAKFKDKLAQALSGNATQLVLFTDENASNTEAID